MDFSEDNPLISLTDTKLIHHYEIHHHMNNHFLLIILILFFPFRTALSHTDLLNS